MNIKIEEYINDNGKWYTITINGITQVDINKQPQLYYGYELKYAINELVSNHYDKL